MVYNDFKARAVSEYKFELEPLPYEDFIESVKEGLLQCYILFDSGVPCAFLVYTTLISESVELNLVHVMGDEDANNKRRTLLEKFVQNNVDLLHEKVVTYPMLGKQGDFVRDITHFGFKLVGHAVVKFSLSNVGSIRILKGLTLPPLEYPYSMTDWNPECFDKAVELIHHSFKDMSDALFDPRFKSISGTTDVVEKITSGTYGEFLGAETKVLLYRDKPIGFCFANLTNPRIGNIPIVVVDKKYRGRGFSKLLLKTCVDSILNTAFNQGLALQEVNACVDTSNFQAVKMYRAVGFKEDYSYPQAYRPAR